MFLVATSVDVDANVHVRSGRRITSETNILHVGGDNNDFVIQHAATTGSLPKLVLRSAVGGGQAGGIDIIAGDGVSAWVSFPIHSPYLASFLSLFSFFLSLPPSLFLFLLFV